MKASTNSSSENDEYYLLEISPDMPFKSLKDCNIGFFIDTSQNTKNVFFNDLERNVPVTYYEAEVSFVAKMNEMFFSHRYFLKMNEQLHIGEFSDILSNTNYGYGNLILSNIFKDPEFPAFVKYMDVAIIVVSSNNVLIDDINLFAYYMRKNASHLKAVIIVLIGKLTNNNDNTTLKPNEIFSTLSIFVPIINTNGCILFHDTEKSYVMWSNGCFKNTWNPTSITEHVVWNEVTNVDFNRIANVELPCYSENILTKLLNNSYISVGPGLFLNLNYMLDAELTVGELLKVPLFNLSIHFILDYDIEYVMIWIMHHKTLISQSLELNNQMDRHASKMLENLDILEYIINLEYQKYMPFSENSTNIDDTNVDQDDFLESENQSSNCVIFDWEDNPWSEFAKIYERKILNNDSNTNMGKMHPNLVTCSNCFHTRVPFILIRRLLRENDLKSTNKKAIDYFYNAIVCSVCTTELLLSGKDPVRAKIYTAFPLIDFKSFSQTNINLSNHNSEVQELKYRFMKHFLEKLVDKSEFIECHSIDQKKRKVENIFSLFIKLLVDGNLRTSENEEYDDDIIKIKNILIRVETFILENKEILAKILETY
ncbi:MAG: hypothetical protein QXW79_00030 [Thermoplasmata archaeon]